MQFSYLDEKMRKENPNNDEVDDDDDGAGDGDVDNDNNQLKTKRFNLLHLCFSPYSYFLRAL